MEILLINPPNCGRSIPEERYGITSLKQIFRGEPLALEELAGNLIEHDVRLLDMKVEPDGLHAALAAAPPDVVGITGVTCEANTMVRIARQVREACRARIVVGGIHAGSDPAFFHRDPIDYIVLGLGKRRFAELLRCLEQGDEPGDIPGVLTVRSGERLTIPAWSSSYADLVVERPPAYELVGRYRSHYVLEKLGVGMGFVASACGCPHRCSFCCIKAQTGGAYLTKPVEAVIREIALLSETPVIRLVDANSFGDVKRAMELGSALRDAGLGKQYLADIRADTVVRHPEMVRLWKKAGLRAVIIGFEEINDAALAAMNKKNTAAVNREAAALLHEMGITIVGDFIISPGYDEEDFDRLTAWIEATRIDLPMITVLTPLPGTALYREQRQRITNHDLDYYTLTNAVLPTRLGEERFYQRYAQLLADSHRAGRL